MMPGVSPEEVLDRRALNRALLERQLLLRRARRSVSDTVEHLLGLQAQSVPPTYYGLWSRLEGFDPHELGRMLTDREAVRMTLMRGTVHLVTVRDALLLRPLVQLVIERGHNGAFGRRMGGADLDELERAVREELNGEAVQARELGRRLVARGIGDDVEATPPARTCRSCRCRRAECGGRAGRRSTRRSSRGQAVRWSEIRRSTTLSCATSARSGRRR